MGKRKTYSKEVQLNPFFDLKDDEFEDLCRDLFGKSNEVVHARKLFGKGYKQFGGDVLVQVDDATSYLVQCKHYPQENFSRSNIEEAVNLFTTYWETHWKQHKVKKFYLVVSRPISTADQLAAIREQIDRLFNDFGVTFVYLEQDDLRNLLKPHRDLVIEYFDDYWWNKICPLETNTAAIGFVSSSVGERVIYQNYEQTTHLLSEQAKKEIEPIRHLARRGKRSESLEKFNELKQKSFAFLNAETRAELLSLEIRLRFPQEMDFAEARELIVQIKQEDANFQTAFLDALVTGHKDGFTSALAELKDCPDISTFNLKLSYLINTDNHAEACRLYESRIESFAFDTETKRLYALALLALGRTQEAENVINEAFQEQLEWEAVRLAKAIIYYYSSQAAQVLLENPLAFPQPRPWHLIKTDFESRQKRREAGEIFKDILASERKDKEETRLFESWYLSCLSDDAERREEAVSYAQSVLESYPTHVYILIWALGRNIPVDFSRSKSALEEKFKALNEISETTAINEALILLPLYLREGQSTKAKQHLKKLKSALGKIGEKDLFAFWECQIALVKGETAVLEKRLTQKIENIELRQSIQISALLTAYQLNPNRTNRRNYEKRLAKICRKSSDPQYLWLYCIFCHSHKNWNEVIKYSSSLLKKIPTGESLRVVCDAYYQSHQPEKCLDILEQHHHLFPHGELPNDLSRLESHCWLNAGRPAKAREIARKVFEREKSADNFLTFVETHRHTGYWSEIKEAVKQMPSLDELTPMQQLQISRMIVSIDQPLAIEMWRAVKKRAQETKEIIDEAFFFGNRLGLDDETGDLMKLMVEHSRDGKNNHRFLNIAEWREMMKERNQQLYEVEQLYLEGKIPTHLYSKENNEPLTVRYHFLPKLNEENENFRTKFKTLIRKGNRIFDSSALFKEKPEWKIHLDISTLLLAHHLDLLSAIEKFAPIYLTTEIIPLLQNEIKHLEDHAQPSRVESAKWVLQALEKDQVTKLQVTRSLSPNERKNYDSIINRLGERDICLFHQAVDGKAIVIDYLPLRNPQNGEAVETPHEFQKIVRGWHSVVNGLLSEGLLTAQIADKSRQELEKKSEDEFVDREPIPIGSKLYLTGLTAQQLAKIGVFKEVCQNFDVFLDERNEQILKNEEKGYEQSQELIQWLKNLQEHLKNGFETDTYRGISEERLKDEPDARNRKSEDYRMHSILELLLLNGTKEDAAVVDDRWLSGYFSLNHQTPILTIYELLLTLKAHGHLSDEEFYGKMHRLRNENFRYLSITKEEILYHLNRAGKRRKSPELSTLRKYLADCLLDEKWLEKPPIPAGPGNYAEMEFVFALQRTIVEIIGHVWSESESIEAAHEQADNLLFDFYTGWFGLRHFFPEALVHQAGAWHLASDFTYFCVQAMGILANQNLTLQQKTERIEAYLNWLNYIFKEHLSNTAFVERTLEFLVVFLGQTSDETETDEESEEVKNDARKTISALEMLMVNHLPEQLRLPLLDNEIIKQKFEFTPETIYSIGEMQFRGDELWDGVAQALRGVKAEVCWKNNNDEILEIKKSSADPAQAKVDVFRADGSSFHLKDGVVGFLLPEHEQRLDFALSNRNSFDCSDDEFFAKVEEILTIDEPLEIAGFYSDWAKSSAQISYENLIREIKRKKGFSGEQISEFPISGLINHFRLHQTLSEHFRLPSEASDAKPFYLEMCAASENLQKESDLETALDRYARFPTELPENLVQEFGILPLEERKSLVEKFRQNWRSPVGKFHYLHLILRCLPEDEESLKQARQEAEVLFKNEEENLDFEIFKSLLMLVADELSREPETKKWALSVRLSLIWAHAVKLFDIISPLADSNEEKSRLLKCLNSARPFWNRQVFDFEPEFWSDCLNPRLLERQSFLGLAAGRLFAGLPTELLDKISLLPLLRRQCYWDLDGKTVPHFWLWKDFNNRTDVVDSFLGARSFALFNLLFDSENRVLIFTQESLQECLITLLQRIYKNPLDSTTWSELIFMTDKLPLIQSLHTEFFKVIKKMDFQAIWENDDELALAILSFLAGQKTILPKDLLHRIEDWLRWAVSRLSEKHIGKLHPNSENRREQENTALFIAEITAWFTVVPFDPLTSSQKWNQLMFDLGHIWSKLPILLEPALLRLWLGLPVEQLQGIGKNLLLAKVLR